MFLILFYFFGKELPRSILLYWHLLLINRLSLILDGYFKTKDFLIIWFMYNDHMQKSNQWKNMWHTVILNVFAKYKTFFCVKRLMSFQYYIMLFRKTGVSLWNELWHCTHIVLYFFVNYYYWYDQCVSTGRWSSKVNYPLPT